MWWYPFEYLTPAWYCIFDPFDHSLLYHNAIHPHLISLKYISQRKRGTEKVLYMNLDFGFRISETRNRTNNNWFHFFVFALPHPYQCGFVNNCTAISNLQLNIHKPQKLLFCSATSTSIFYWWKTLPFFNSTWVIMPRDNYIWRML